VAASRRSWAPTQLAAIQPRLRAVVDSRGDAPLERQPGPLVEDQLPEADALDRVGTAPAAVADALGHFVRAPAPSM
jgi:hypothetical protein